MVKDVNSKANMFRVPDKVRAWAEKEAAKQCRTTGKPVRWSDVVRQVLEERCK